MSHIRLSLALLLTLCLAGAGLFAEDWPQWGRTNERNMISPAKGLVDTFTMPQKLAPGEFDMATGANVLWIARLGTLTSPSPVVAGGKVFVGTNDAFPRDERHRRTQGGMLMCFDAATGKFIWELPMPRLLTIPNFEHMNLGICSTANVEGSRLYIVSSRGEVLCMDVDGMANGNDGPFMDEAGYSGGPGGAIEPGATDGDIIWKFDMISECKIWPQDCSDCSILIDGDVLYVCTSNGVDKSHRNVPNPLAPSLIALDKKTGRLLAGDDEKINQRLFHGQWSSPSMGMVNGRKQIFYGGGDGVCYAFEPVSPSAAAAAAPAKLRKIWSYDCNPPEYKAKDGKPIRYADPNGPSEIIGTPTFYKNRVYVTVGQDTLHGKGKGILNCIDATKTGDVTGTGKVWAYDKLNRSTSTVSIADGLLYVLDFDGKTHCLDADTGAVHWVHDNAGPLTMASTMVADGKVYFGTAKGDFWTMAAGKELKVLGKVAVGAPIHSTPAIADGVIYFTSDTHLFAIGKRK